MMTVSELQKICEKIVFEYGHDTSVCIQLYNNDTNTLIEGSYCMNHFINTAGVLYLTNERKLKKEE